MATKILHGQLTPLVLNQAAAVAPKYEVRFDSPPTSVKLHLEALGSDLMLTPDSSGKVFTTSVPVAALTTGLGPADVNRKFIGHLSVTTGTQTDIANVFGDVLTADIPAVTIHAVASDVQSTEHLVNIAWPSLADDFKDVFSHIGDITHKFFTHFDDEFDFIHLVFGKSYYANRGGFATRNAVQGIGMEMFDHNSTYGSAGRLTGMVVFPMPTFFDGIAPATFHEIGHRWLVGLKFPPLGQSNPHWPISDLAGDLMGYSDVNGQGLHFLYTLQPVGGGKYQLVPDTQPKVFSDLAQYVMGMRPAGQVGSHFVFDNQTQPLVDNGILSGPVTKVTVNDVIAHYGARSPDFADSQKRFRIATILVTKSALAPLDTMRLYDFLAARANANTPLAYTDGLTKDTALPFSTVTGGAGRLDARIKRHILIDSSRDGGVWWFPQAGPFTSMAPHQGKALADHLRSLGHTVQELPRPTTITPVLLADYDIVIRAVGMGSYSPSEIAAYDAWVQQGGGLLLLAEHHANDTLATHFGLQFKSITRGECMLSIFANHPITAGVAPIFYGAGSALISHPPSATVLGWLSLKTFVDLDGDGTKDPEESLKPAGLGVMPFGNGRIVFCGDTNLWETMPNPLLQNTLRWLST